MKEFKCPICGCTEHYPISLIENPTKETIGGPYSDNPYRTIIKTPRTLLSYEFSISGDASGLFALNGSAEVYLCAKCGHIELFGENMLARLNRDKQTYESKINELKDELDKLDKEVSSLKSESELLKEKLVKLGKLLASDEITVKQQREYKEESVTIKSKCNELDQSLKVALTEIEKKQKELSETEDRAKKIIKYDSIETRKGMW